MNIFGVSYHSVMCDMRYIHNGIHMRGEIHFAFEDRNMAPVPLSYMITSEKRSAMPRNFE